MYLKNKVHLNPDEDIYQGEMLDGKPNGKGFMIDSKNGFIY